MAKKDQSPLEDDLLTMRTAPTSVQEATGLQGTHGFPKSNIISSDHKEARLACQGETKRYESSCGTWTVEAVPVIGRGGPQ